VVLGSGVVVQTAETLSSPQDSGLGSRNQMKEAVQSAKGYGWGGLAGALRGWYSPQLVIFS